MELRTFGFDDHFQQAFQPYAGGGFLPGRVLLQFNHIYTVVTQDGEVHAQCSGRLRHQAAPDDRAQSLPVTGDWVAVQASGDGAALIQAVLPRRSAFSRKAAGRAAREQVLAANLDVALLLIGLDNDYSPRRVERYLAATWESGAAPVVVLNKLDLCRDAATPMEEIHRVAAGAPVHGISALYGDGVEDLAAYLAPGRTLALLGSSGVGKTTLLNRLSGSDLPTQPVRAGDDRGRHTTTRRELLVLPSGAMIIDTPGLRELQLWDSDEGVQRTFDEIETLARGCRFRDCRHRDEPGCAVQAAVQQGRLDAARLAALHKLQGELAWLERREDSRAALAEKQRWKTIHKAVKRMQRDSPKHR